MEQRENRRRQGSKELTMSKHTKKQSAASNKCGQTTKPKSKHLDFHYKITAGLITTVIISTSLLNNQIEVTYALSVKKVEGISTTLYYL